MVMNSGNGDPTRLKHSRAVDDGESQSGFNTMECPTVTLLISTSIAPAAEIREAAERALADVILPEHNSLVAILGLNSVAALVSLRERGFFDPLEAHALSLSLTERIKAIIRSGWPDEEPLIRV